MAYFTEAEMKATYTTKKINELLADGGTASALKFSLARTKAQNEVDLHFGVKFPVPLSDPVPNDAKMAAIHIAVYNLAKGKSLVTETIKTNYGEAMQDLKDIRDNKRVVKELSEADPIGEVFSTSTNKTKAFGAQGMRGYDR